ncbi:MAG: hypothetical protein J0H36_01445 [Hyphomicrobium denitrificans]|uniref:Uncharacterized protein n=1 Tax=Hyphomicrobium denitrificans (strain ATCC 51888 / DSM 1869 / NCIMB 11706 / TK 0415) TaxID=582899 RepID=D8JWK8_HYPDA|nr:hypothetical protein [Hyphomicrobium denitrificans]ADJ23121.1 hypothetical protein Hden_1309 [Hyphomicrobium denitrificans ATCC 51888]MBN9289797.1 hypothetical protein [Hyphomicrobium denitrificans]
MQRSASPLFLGTALAVIAGWSISAFSDAPARVKGYFCGAKSEQVAYMQRLAAGDSEEIAANTVNKSAGKQTCAYFLPADAIPVKDQVVMSGGLVFKVQSFVFLPEKVERWTGTYFGSMHSKSKYGDI